MHKFVKFNIVIQSNIINLATEYFLHHLQKFSVEALFDRLWRFRQLRSLQPHEPAQCRRLCQRICPRSSMSICHVSFGMKPHTFTGICVHPCCWIQKSLWNSVSWSEPTSLPSTTHDKSTQASCSPSHLNTWTVRRWRRFPSQQSSTG